MRRNVRFKGTKNNKSKPKYKLKSKPKYKLKSNHTSNHKSKHKSKPKYHLNSEYGDWSQVIYELQNRHSKIGNKLLTWYQAKPDGNCFFISVDGAIRKDKDVHNIYKNSAKILRRKIVDSMESLLGGDAGIAFEMNHQLPPKFGRLSTAPSSVTPSLLNNYKKYMSQHYTWAGQIELTLTAKLLKRPIIVFYNNRNPPTIIWYDGRHQNPYKNISQLRGEPEPIILGHIPKSGSEGGIHYVYALYENIGSIKKKNKTKKRKNTKRKNKK